METFAVSAHVLICILNVLGRTLAPYSVDLGYLFIYNKLLVVRNQIQYIGKSPKIMGRESPILLGIRHYLHS